MNTMPTPAEIVQPSNYGVTRFNALRHGVLLGTRVLADRRTSAGRQSICWRTPVAIAWFTEGLRPTTDLVEELAKALSGGSSIETHGGLKPWSIPCCKLGTVQQLPA